MKSTAKSVIELAAKVVRTHSDRDVAERLLQIAASEVAVTDAPEMAPSEAPMNAVLEHDEELEHGDNGMLGLSISGKWGNVPPHVEGMLNAAQELFEIGRKTEARTMVKLARNLMMAG